jgi:UPF0755 protein
MTRKWVLPILGILGLGSILLYLYLNRSATSFPEEYKLFYIPTDSADAEWTVERLRRKGILKETTLIGRLSARQGNVNWVKPGRYRIKNGMSQREVFNLLRSGTQEPVKFVVNKFRLPEDFAKYAARQLECDSSELVAFLRSPDSLSRFKVDADKALTLVIPNTYSMRWNTDASSLMKRMGQERDRFWNEDRKAKAAKLGLTPEQVYALASIVEEETNKHDEKPVIASVYLNRYRKGMPLGADPTIKFAMRDFGLKRILLRHIEESASSPYNTYKNAGIPPGPICTPSIKSIEAVLEPADTDYLFFCAKSDFSGYHAFAVDDREHMRNARAYQRALDSLMAARKMD